MFPTDDQLATLTMSTDAGDGWRVEVVLVPHGDDELRIDRFSLVPDGGPVEIADPRAFKRLRLTGLQQRIERQLPLVLSGMMPDNVKTPTVTAPKPGRGGYSDLEYAVWARDYVDAVREHPTRPIAALVESDPKKRNAADWRRWLATAEGKGLLADRPKATEGRAGGRLTKKAERILADAGLPITTTTTITKGKTS